MDKTIHNGSQKPSMKGTFPLAPPSPRSAGNFLKINLQTASEWRSNYFGKVSRALAKNFEQKSLKTSQNGSQIFSFLVSAEAKNFQSGSETNFSKTFWETYIPPPCFAGALNFILNISPSKHLRIIFGKLQNKNKFRTLGIINEFSIKLNIRLIRSIKALLPYSETLLEIIR